MLANVRHVVVYLAIGVVPAEAMETCGRLDLEIARVELPPTQYQDFCERHPEACDLSGASTINWDETRSLLLSVNRDVNEEVELSSDMACWGVEEYWSFPAKGLGDCEDFALEKRRRLVDEGLPSAALTMAIVHHTEGLFAHAVLLAETTAGTRVLDNLNDDLLCWDTAPFRYERRERPDGAWARYAIP